MCCLFEEARIHSGVPEGEPRESLAGLRTQTCVFEAGTDRLDQSFLKRQRPGVSPERVARKLAVT